MQNTEYEKSAKQHIHRVSCTGSYELGLRGRTAAMAAGNLMWYADSGMYWATIFFPGKEVERERVGGKIA